MNTNLIPLVDDKSHPGDYELSGLEAERTPTSTKWRFIIRNVDMDNISRVTVLDRLLPNVHQMRVKGSQCEKTGKSQPGVNTLGKSSQPA
ncbi:MAG: hypothetical protein GY896_22555 [Gammaproteobacteria bacterium]|nr:hypothetical protein [Gammaproteobacteria bacterium]